MSRLVAHRGPDANGAWEDAAGRVGLAHRRLSVIDPQCGQQPMMDAERGLHLIFNGEIYNYRELRTALIDEGVTFRTDSDTEVLLWMFRKHGIACLDFLTGMFAFAIWDSSSEELFLVRDRIGEKPLYYSTEAGCIYFASTFAALARTARAPARMNPATVLSFMDLGYIPAPMTIHEGIRKLQAGTYVRVHAGAVSTTRYWNPAADGGTFEGSFDDAVDRLQDLVHTSVRLRLRSDVPLGIFLSGGIDSSLVAAVAAREAANGVATFSIGFDETDFDESGYAAQVARLIGSEHREFRAQADLLSLLPKMVDQYGEPFGDSSALPTWLLAGRAREFVTVALGGDGGDEAFAGYDWYRNALRLNRVSAMSAGLARPLASVARESRWPAAARLQRGADLMVQAPAERFAGLRSFLGSRGARRLFTEEVLCATTAGERQGTSLLAEWYGRAPGTDLRRMRTVDVATYLPDCLLTKVDVATMAHGLEARAPLLDPDIVRFGLSLPDNWLVSRSGGKRILKSLLYRYLPASLFERPKKGFSVPLRHWFRGPLKGEVESLPDSPDLMDTGWFRREGLQSLVNEHVQGIRNHDQRLYFLLTLDRWLHQQ